MNHPESDYPISDDFKHALKNVEAQKYKRHEATHKDFECIYKTFIKYKIGNSSINQCLHNIKSKYLILAFKKSGVFSEIYNSENVWLMRFQPNNINGIRDIISHNLPSEHNPNNTITFPFILSCLFDGINHALTKLNNDTKHNTELISDSYENNIHRINELEDKIQRQNTQIETLEKRLQEMERRFNTFVIRSTIPPPPHTSRHSSFHFH